MKTLPIFSVVRSAWQSLRRQHRVHTVKNVVKEAPLILQLETINVCNAACVFCGYTSMKRKKGVMTMEHFTKAVHDYVKMGGGPVSLTPIVGDALLDPHLMERLRMLENLSEINQVSLTTNAIALERYTDDDVKYMLELLDCVQLSIGGLDSEKYKLLYAVDRFDQVSVAMDRFIQLNKIVKKPTLLIFAFRTNDPNFEKEHEKRLNEFREQGVKISHIFTYANYSGLVQSNEKLNLDVKSAQPIKKKTCAIASVHMAVCWDGRVTACGCADVQGDGLIVGHTDKESLKEIWQGKKRTGFLASFSKNKPPKICQGCSFYQPDDILSGDCFKNKGAHQPVSPDFFQSFWGG